MVTEFRYQNIELCKAQKLGSGSYGGVCKAMCDGLLCAAKIMHSTLFDLRDPGAGSYLSKFQEECRLLSRARHPNIVQYLATSIDPETQLPVLLMELCDDSLTAFLQNQHKGLPYFTQVDICHDIALALIYLHSNGLIHRDLTGNNVLIVSGPRAKITDFGMSKLTSIDQQRLTTLTLCPGNMLYMSPEALDEAPYTEKLDIFSFGVITIQILTRKFPNPTNRLRSIPSSRVETTGDEEAAEVRQLVPEKERRVEHLTLIPETHPLKSLTLNCIKRKESARPSALDLSEQLLGLKQLPQYAESRQDPEREDVSERIQAVARDHAQIEELQRQISNKEAEISDCRTSISRLNMQLRESQETVQSLSRHIQAKENEIVILKEAMEGMEMELVDVKEKLRDSEEIVSTMQESLLRPTPPIEQLPEEHEEHELLQELPSPEESVQSEAASSLLSEGEAQGDDIVPIVSPPSFEEDKETEALVVHGSSPPQLKLSVFDKKARTPSEMKWSRGKSSPEPLRRGSAVLMGNKAYIRPVNSTKVYSYENIVGIQLWSELPENINANSGLVVFDGHLTTVGGIDKGPSNSLLSLVKRISQKEWVAKYPAMPTGRYNAACVTTENVLIVAGGLVADEGLNIVEVMEINTKQWSAVCSLPEKCGLMSATISGDQLYLAGGLSKNKATNSTFSCSISYLLSSSALGSKLRHVFSSNRIWKRIASVPVTRTTLVTFNDHILAIGGEDDRENSTTDVYQYQFDTNSWSKVNKLNEKRSWCVAVPLPEDRLMVVGGYTYSNSVTSVVEVLDRY